MDNRESLKQKLSEKSDGLWHLQTDSLPDWVTDSINQVNVIHSLNPVKVRPYIKNLAFVVIYAISIFMKLPCCYVDLGESGYRIGGALIV